MKHSELKQLIKEEIRSALNEGLFDRFQKSDNKLEQAKKEIDQTDFNNFFIQPASFRIPAEEKSMIISQLKKRVAERLPTLISLFPNLVSGNTLYNLRSNVNGELIYGVTLGNLGGYITNDYLIIDNDIAKTKLKKNLKLDEGLREEETDKTDEVVDDIKDEMSSVLKALDNELEKKSKTQNEGLLTVAGIALALPAIMGLIAKFGKAAGNTVKKLLGKKPTDKDEYAKWMAKLGNIADDLHHLYMAPIKGIVNKFIKDKSKADKVASAIFHVIVATFLVISGATAIKALQAKNLSLTTLEAALTAVKGGEVKAFISKLI